MASFHASLNISNNYSISNEFSQSFVSEQHYDHTLQDHFCSVIDEFPVWNSEPDQPTMMSWAAGPEREKELESFRDNSSLMIAYPPLLEDGRTCCCLSGY